MVQSVNNLQRGVMVGSVPEEESVVEAQQEVGTPKPLAEGSYAERVGVSAEMIRWHFERRMQANVRQNDADPCATAKCVPLPNYKLALFVRGAGDNGEVELNDIKQGYIGDCYLMAALGSIARLRPELIKRMITEVRDAQGAVVAYKVTLYKDGQRVEVMVDAKGFPRTWTKDIEGEPTEVGFHANVTGDRTADGADEIWTLIIEKAYATLYGGYKKIGHGGSPSEAMTTLLGNPSSVKAPNEYSFEDLKRDVEQGRPVVLGTVPAAFRINIFGQEIELWDYDEIKSKLDGLGLKERHAYVVIDAREINGQKFVTLYNPWGTDHPRTDLSYEKAKELFGHVYVGTLPAESK